jgi:probable H4MPT-linked C1 transfer pathway protein
MAMASVLGLDIGGANLKAAHTAGRAFTRPFALWKAPERLVDHLRIALAGSPPFDHLAVTMTGELCDCFESKRQGVKHILDAVEQAAGATPVWVWTNAGTFVSLAEARSQLLPAASANWLALATFAGRYAPSGPALLIDIGTTTTDIIPLVDGQPVPAGRTDAERFKTGELIYIGWRRTPLCAFLGTSLAAEVFATTLDAYLVLKIIPDDPGDLETADGRPATRAAANRRLARMLGGDQETTTQGECVDLAQEIHFQVVNRIADAARDVIERLPAAPRLVIASGTGEFLMPGVLASRLFKAPVKDCPVFSLREKCGVSASAAACALAVAILCQEWLQA